MSHVDALLVLLVVPFAFNGWRRGFCREGFDFVGLIGGLIVAVAMAPAGAAALGTLRVPKLAAFPIALAGVLIVMLVVARMMGAIGAQALQAARLGGLDRAAGVGLGALKGVACIGLILTLLDSFVPTPAVQIAIHGSFLGPQMMRVATSALAFSRELSSVARGV